MYLNVIQAEDVLTINPRLTVTLDVFKFYSWVIE